MSKDRTEVPGAALLGNIRGVTPPRQQRSWQTFDAILDGAERLLVEHKLGEISMNDICAEANVSISSLYARFDSKEAILRSLYGRYAEESIMALDRIRSMLDDEPPETFEILVQRVLAEWIRFARRHWHLLATFRAEAVIAPERARIEHEVYHRVTDTVAAAQLLFQPASAWQLEFISFTFGNVIQGLINAPAEVASHLQLSDELLAREYASMIVGYLDRANPPLDP